MSQYPLTPYRPSRVRIANLVPFTYRDTMSLLEKIENLQKYVEQFVPEVNDSIQRLVDEFALINEGQLETFNIRFQEFVDQINVLVALINNKTGPVDVQHIELTQDLELSVDPLFPDNHIVTYEIEQTGNFTITATDNLTGTIDATPVEGSRFVVFAVPKPVASGQPGQWFVYQPREETRKMLRPVIEHIDVVTTALQGEIDSLIGDVRDTNAELAGRLSDATLNTKYAKNDYANVLDSGAKGDGITDDTGAVAAAMSSLTKGGTLYFPPGIYKINGHIEALSNVHITGYAATLLKTVGSAGAALFVATAKTALGYSSGKTNITISGLTFRGDLANNVSMCALAANRAGNIHVMDCKFLECTQNGHVFDLQGCENVYINNSKFAGIKGVIGRGYTEAIQIDASIRIGSSFPESVNAQEVFDGIATRNVYVESCIFEPLRVGSTTYPAQSPIGSHTYVDGKPYTNINFINNYVDGVIKNDGSYPGIIHFLGVNGLTVSGNVISGAEENTAIRTFGGTNAIPLADSDSANATNQPAMNPVNPKNVRIEGNYFKKLNAANDDHLIWVYGSAGSDANNLKVLGNVFDDCNNKNGSGYLMQLTRSTDVRVSNNSGEANGKILYSANVQSLTFDGNQFSKTLLNCVNIEGINSALIDGNNLDGSGLVRISGTEKVILTSNTMTITIDENCVSALGPVPQSSIIITANMFQGPANATLRAIGISPSYKNGVVVSNISRGYKDTVNTFANLTVANNVAD